MAKKLRLLLVFRMIPIFVCTILGSQVIKQRKKVVGYRDVYSIV